MQDNVLNFIQIYVQIKILMQELSQPRSIFRVYLVKNVKSKKNSPPGTSRQLALALNKQVAQQQNASRISKPPIHIEQRRLQFPENNGNIYAHGPPNKMARRGPGHMANPRMIVNKNLITSFFC